MIYIVKNFEDKGLVVFRDDKPYALLSPEAGTYVKAGDLLLERIVRFYYFPDHGDWSAIETPMGYFWDNGEEHPFERRVARVLGTCGHYH